MQVITAQELKENLQSGRHINLVDVREPHEHTEFNIGGILLPLGQIQTMMLDDIEDLRSQEVICYCRSGQRSMQACMMLETFGFTNVKNLSGGMLGWKDLYGG
jgi:rhodanese-related sulfurtransferase